MSLIAARVAMGNPAFPNINGTIAYTGENILQVT